MLRPWLRILLVAALCVAGLIGLVVRETMARASGTEVLLAMEAIDPRALLSGHYVIVGLQEATTIPDQCKHFQNESPDNAPQWIAFRERQLLTEVAGVPASSHVAAGQFSTRSAALRHGAIAALGSAICTDPVLNGDVMTSLGVLRLDLGINRFHINQADAERIEDVLFSQRVGEETRLFAIVSVGQDGRARLKGLMVDGERLELNWR